MQTFCFEFALHSQTTEPSGIKSGSMSSSWQILGPSAPQRGGLDFLLDFDHFESPFLEYLHLTWKFSLELPSSQTAVHFLSFLPSTHVHEFPPGDVKSSPINDSSHPALGGGGAQLGTEPL